MPYLDVEAKRAAHRRYLERRKQNGGAPLKSAAPPNVPRPRPVRGETGVAHEVSLPTRKDGLRVAFIPDCQIIPGCPMQHLPAIGKYLAAKRPDVIVNAGDFADMPSLSRFGRGTRAFEGRRYRADIDAARKAMELLMAPIAREAGYRPALHFTLGNHEDHIDRATQENAALHGLMSVDDLRYADFGWTVHPFLQPIVVGGVAFSHYFPSGVMDRPVGTAENLLRRLHMSAVAGHQQGRQIATARRADGALMTGIIAGSCYLHDMDYLSPLSNVHWRGIYMLHQVRDGSFDEMAVSLSYLLRKFR